VSRPARSAAGFTILHATDASHVTELVGDWNFEYAQLKKGGFRADGALLEFDGVSLARVAMSQTMLHTGYAPRNMVAVMIPGAGCGQAFVSGQSVESGQCMTLSEGAFLEGITHGHYLDISIGFDLTACRAQLDALNGGSFGLARGMTIVAPGPAWINETQARIEWLMTSATEQPEFMSNARVRASLSDHLLAAMVRLDNAPADVDSTTRTARAIRRVAVRLARDFINARLSEPIREHDGIAPPSVMERRVAALRRAGTEVEFHRYGGVGHGFGPGIGTSAEGWQTVRSDSGNGSMSHATALSINSGHPRHFSAHSSE